MSSKRQLEGKERNVMINYEQRLSYCLMMGKINKLRDVSQKVGVEFVIGKLASSFVFLL